MRRFFSEQDQAIVFDLTAGDHVSCGQFGSVGMVFSAISTEFFRLDACDDTFDEPTCLFTVCFDEQVEQQHGTHTTRAACAFADGLSGQVPVLCDAQGGRIPVSSCKKVVFELETDGSPKAILKERVHVGAVQSPLISLGVSWHVVERLYTAKMARFSDIVLAAECLFI